MNLDLENWAGDPLILDERSINERTRDYWNWGENQRLLITRNWMKKKNQRLLKKLSLLFVAVHIWLN